MLSRPPDTPPTTQEDLHVLIALASKIIGKQLATPNKVRRNAPFAPKCSILPAAHQEPNQRPFPILDTIASLSVFQESGQVVAVALQMDRDANTVTLTVSENRADPVDPRVVVQIEGIWKLLQALSLASCQARALSHRMQDSEPSGYSCPESRIAPEVSAARLELVRVVYTFCWKKMSVRVSKWWPDLDAMSMDIMSYLYIDGNPDPSGLMNEFLSVAIMFRMAFAMIEKRPSESFSPGEWSVFSARMDIAVEKAVQILHNDDECEQWGKRFTDHHHHIPVRRALGKLASLHRSIAVLVRFANSPHLRAALTSELVVIPMTPPPLRQVVLPSSINDWQTTVDRVCAGNHLVTADWIKTQAVGLADHFDASNLCVTHCECSLIAHLEATRAKTPAFSYIGVSKHSCPACILWIRAFNHHAGRRYFTRGTDGKRCWPWTAPAGLSDYEAGMMAEAVHAECVRFIEVNDRLRAGSDVYVDKAPLRRADVTRKMDREIEGGFESMLKKLKAKVKGMQ